MNEEICYIGQTARDKSFYITIAGISHPDPTYEIRRADSPVLTIEYIISGSGIIRRNGVTYRAKRGDIYLLPIGVDHYYRSSVDDPWEKIWFNASGPLVNALIDAYALSDCTLIEDSGGFVYFERMLSLCRENRPAEEINRTAAVIFHELVQYLSTRAEPVTIHEPDDAAKLKNAIDSRIKEGISIAELAECIYKSPSQVRRIFKREYGMSPHEYLLDKRMIRARAMLTDTNLRIREIARLVGFEDEHYFSHYFKEKCGLSPISYRNRQ